MSAIEVDRPFGGGPGADQHAPVAETTEVLDQLTAGALALIARQYIGVPDQVDVAHRLNAHDSDQHTVRLVAPKHDTGIHLGVELARSHVWLMPAIGGDHAAIRHRGGVDDGEDRCALIFTTKPDAAQGLGGTGPERSTELPDAAPRSGRPSGVRSGVRAVGPRAGDRLPAPSY